MTALKWGHAPHRGLALLCFTALCMSACAEPDGPPLDPRPAIRSCNPWVDGAPVRLLSETGCFDDVATLLPAEDLVPYGVNSALWTDGASKTRYVSIPPESVLRIDGDRFVLPEGGALIKVFRLAVQQEGMRKDLTVEVRFLVRAEERSHLFTYRFNEEISDAVLVEEPDTLELVAADGHPITYQILGETSCGVCHGPDLRMLGFAPLQLDGDFDYGPGRATTNQLDALRGIGLLEGEREELTALVDPRGSADLEIRGRSWLHANCAHCHRPGGYAPSSIGMDLRMQTPLLETGLCEPVRFGSFTRYDRLEPYYPDYSAIVLRIEAEGFDRMPPVGVSRPDEFGAQLLREWIGSMRDCGEE